MEIISKIIKKWKELREFCHKLDDVASAGCGDGAGIVYLFVALIGSLLGLAVLSLILLMRYFLNW